MTRKEVPIKGQTKSMCILCHGLVGQVHGCRGAGDGAFLFCWHEMHVLAICSMS